MTINEINAAFMLLNIIAMCVLIYISTKSEHKTIDGSQHVLEPSLKEDAPGLTPLQKQILANRLVFAKGLQDPSLKKHRGQLSNQDRTAHCCLGHGCNIFSIPYTEATHASRRRWFYGKAGRWACAPKELIDKIYLRDETGSFTGCFNPLFFYKEKSYGDLLKLNDRSNISIQEIGKIMQEKWLMGGDQTPFIAIEKVK